MSYSYSSTYRFNRSNFEKSKETNGFKAWRKAQYDAQSGHCAWCYKTVEYKDMDVDHIIPLGRAGLNTDLNDFDNLVLACRECNRDKKIDTTYNYFAYNNALAKMTKQQKQEGLAPRKVYWKRPEWIGPNRLSKTYRDYSPIDTPLSERNVWEIDAPLIRDYSLKVSDFDYTKSVVSDKIDENAETIWKVIKWVAIGGIILLIINAFSQSSSSNNSSSTTTKTNYCGYECQEESRRRFEAEEERERQRIRDDGAEEAKRYWNCKNAGGSDYDCG